MRIDLPSQLVAVKDPRRVELGLDGLRVPDLVDDHALVTRVAVHLDIVLVYWLIWKLSDVIGVQPDVALLAKVVQLGWTRRHSIGDLALRRVSYNVKVSNRLELGLGCHCGWCGSGVSE